MQQTSLWQRFFPNEPYHIDAFRRAVLDQAPAKGAILDLGCGDNTDFASLRSPECEVWGADFQRHPQLSHPDWFRILQPDGSIPFPDNTFDLVTAQWVLEHVEQPIAFLREVRRVLRPRGVFLAHSINGKHYVAMIRRAFNLLPHQAAQWVVQRLYGRAPHDTFVTRYRLNTHFQIARAARTAGLSVRGMTLFACQGYFSFNRLAFNTAKVTDWALEALCPGWGRIYFTVKLQAPAETMMTEAPRWAA